jgi:carnitine 3-dehydrogenase
VLLRLGATAGADPAAWRFEADPVRAVEGAEFVQENAPERYEVSIPPMAAA